MKQLIQNIHGTFPRKLLLLLTVMLVGVGEAWGAYDRTFYARCRTISQPTQGGFVGIYQDAQDDASYSFVTLTDDITGVKSKRERGLGSGPSSTNIEFHAYQKANPGYTFQRWSKDPNATSGGITSTTNHLYWDGGVKNCPYYSLEVSANSTNSNGPTIWTYYAIFSPNTYNVSLNKNGGTGGTSSVTATYDAAMPVATAPTRTGYTFQGYYDSESGGTQYYNADMTSAHNWDKTANTTLYARWQAIPYTVTLDNNGGSGGTTSVTANYGVAMPAATAPSKTGYTFGGYYDSNGTQYYTSSMESARNWDKTTGATLTARWTANKYDVTLNQKDGTGGTASVKATYDAAMPAATAPTKTGYTFHGYFDVDAPTGGNQYYTSTMASARNWDKTSNTMLYARWTVNTYSVTFDQNYSGAPSPTSITQTYDNNYSLPSDPTRAGYTFLGWYTSATAKQGNKITTSNIVKITEPTTLYAHWAADFYFNVTAGRVTQSNNAWGTPSVSGVNNHVQVEGESSSTQTATFATTIASGCTFEGWYTTNDIHTGTRVSSNTTYAPSVVNSTPGSTTTLALYAYYKHNQTLTWNNPSLDTNDPLVVGKSVVNTAATSSEGQTVTYTSSNPEALEVDASGNLTPKKEVTGTVCITATAGNDSYNTVSITRCFIVKERKTPVFDPASGQTFNQKVEDTFTINVDKVSDGLNGDFKVSASPTGIVSWTRSGNVLTISCDHPGSTTLTFAQTGNDDIYAATATYTINVTRYANNLSITVPDTYYVDESKNVTIDGRNSNADIEVTIKGAINSTQRNPNQSYKDSVISYAGTTISAWNKGTATITFTQPQNNKFEGFTKTVNVTVNKYTNGLTANVSPISLLVEGTATLSLNNEITEVTSPTVEITNNNLPTHPNPNGHNEIITIAGNEITAHNAGSATVVVSHEANYKYEAATTSSFEITVGKHPNTITVNGAAGSYTKNLYLSETQSISITSTNSNGPIRSVTQTSGANYATYSGDGTNGTVTALYTPNTTATWSVAQDQDYKYQSGSATITVNVSALAETGCYVLEDNGSYSIYDDGVSKIFELSGPGETLTFQGRRDCLASNSHFYLEASVDGANWNTRIIEFDLHNDCNAGKDEWENYSYAISSLDPNIRYIRFQVYDVGWTTRYFRHVKVTRKTYLQVFPYSSANQDKLSPALNFGTTLENATVQRQFYVEWSSSNTGDIHLSSNNPHFTVSPSIISNTDCASGRTLVTVTYLADEHPSTSDITHSGTITVYDKSRVTSINVSGTTQPQYNLVVSGKNNSILVEDDLNLSDIITYSYEGNSVVPAAPTYGAGSSPFYFTITQDNITSNQNGCSVQNTVVTYNPSTKKFHACNAGTVTITFIQEEDTGTPAVHAGMKVNGAHQENISFTITVSKHDPEFTWNLPNAEWASQYKFGDFFQSTNTTTSWSAVSNTDIAVYDNANSKDSIYTNYQSGNATFTVTQEENYYWSRKEQTVTTIVGPGEETECYLYESPQDEPIRVWDFQQVVWGKDTVVAGKVIFEAMRGPDDWFDRVDLTVKQFINGVSSDIMTISDQPHYDEPYGYYVHALDTSATGLSFKNEVKQYLGEALDYSNRVKNVKIALVPWIKASATDVTLPTIGKQGHSEATVTVYWSGVEPLRIEKKNNNPHFDVSPDPYFVQMPCRFGFSVLTFAYHSDEPGNETETIVIYDHAHSLEITLHGTTENKEMQEIVWNQSFNPILAPGGIINADSLLTAYAVNRSGTETHLPITYTVENTSIARIENGNHLHITNTGRTTITATVVGNDSYSGATKTLILNVLDGTGCGSLAFSNESEVTLFTVTSDDALAVTKPAEDLYFEAKRDWIAFLNPAAQHVKMRYKVKGDNNWRTQDENGVEIETGALNSDWGSYGPFRLPENTEGIQFYTEFGAYFSQHVRNVYITQRSYLRKDKDALTANILVNTLTEVGEFTVEYSDKPTLIVENKCSNVSLFVDKQTPNECGTAGKYTYTVSCFSDTIGIIKDTVTVTSGLDDKLSVPVTIYVGIDGEFFFDNGIDHDITHTDWNVSQYWRKDNVYDHGRIPTMASLTTIEGPTVIDYDAYAYKMTITGSGKVTIAPKGSLKVGAGGIHGATMSNLVLEADNTGQTGVLRVYPGTADANIPNALVQIYTTAYWDRENGKKAVWQYIGTPVRNPDTNEHIFYQCWLYQYHQDQNKWKNAGNWGHMVPFQAYAFTRDKKSSGPLTGFGGQLNAVSAQMLQLSYVDAKVCENHLANSWTAPIDLKQFKATDFQNVDPIIYCYTMDGHGLAKEIPVYTAGYTEDDILPAMQGFFVKAKSNENPQLLLDYERLVWKSETQINAPLRAPSRMNEEESDLSARVCVQMTSADSITDRLFLLEKDDEGFSADYEVGYDAPKYFVNGLPCIYTYEVSGNHLAVSATDNVVGTYLAINTNASQNYTLKFSKVVGEGLGLRDLVTNTVVPISEGMEYAFTAPANSSPMLRFVVVEHEETPQWNENGGTSLEDVGGELKIWQNGEILSVIGAGSHANLRLYDATGKLILSEFFNEATAINMTALPTGVYMVQVNDQTEKVLR